MTECGVNTYKIYEKMFHGFILFFFCCVSPDDNKRVLPACPFRGLFHVSSERNGRVDIPFSSYPRRVIGDF